MEMAERGVPVSQRVFGAGHYLRPQFVQPYRCANVLIEGVRLINSPMWQVHPVLCTNVTVKDVSMQAAGPNTDGAAIPNRAATSSSPTARSTPATTASRSSRAATPTAGACTRRRRTSSSRNAG